MLCDGVEDPHNLGAIVRSAYLCGAHGVVIPKRGGVGVTGTVMKASAGAAARLPVARVPNLAQAIRTIKEHNIFVYCADLGGAPLAKTDLSGPVALVLGSEGGGPRRPDPQAVRRRRHAGNGPRPVDRRGQLQRQRRRRHPVLRRDCAAAPPRSKSKSLSFYKEEHHHAKQTYQ